MDSKYNENDGNGNYNSWLAKHPSALDKFEELMAIANDKKIFIFLDYDGTLSSIIEDPEKAFMTDEMRSAVKEVGNCFPTAVISGRSLEKVIGFVKLDNIYYAGSHGMDILTPYGSLKFDDHIGHTRVADRRDIRSVIFQPAKDFLPTIQEIKGMLNEKIKTIEGAWIEDNRFCISVHFRSVQEKDYPSLKEIVTSAMKVYPDFRITGGRKVMEIRPPVDWDKGRALEYILDALGFDSCKDGIPIYLGDDRSDEDAFKVIKHLGRGFPIVVSSIPKQTEAAYSLRDPAEVMAFLSCLVKWKGSSSSEK